MSINQNSSENQLGGSPFIDRTVDPRSAPKNPAGRITSGVIMRVNAARGVCAVIAENNYYTNVALPNLESDPAGPGGSITGFRQGQPVRLLLGKGIVQILSLMPVHTDRDLDAAPRFTVNDETETISPGERDDVSYTAGPRDVTVGDWVRMGNQGQSFSLSEGGVARMKSSPMSQIVTSAHEGTTKVIGRNLKLYSGFGQMNFRSKGGKNYLEIQGNPDQLHQRSRSTDGKDVWRYQYLVGSPEADGFVDTRISDLTGNRIYNDSLDLGGNQSLSSKGSYTARWEGRKQESIGGSRMVQLDTGDDSVYLEQGKRIEHYAGGQTTEIMESKYCRVGGSRRDRTVGDWSFSSRNMSFNISGDAIAAHPFSNALDYTVSNGSVNFDIGNPLSGDLLKSLSGFHINQFGPGAIELFAKDLGQIYLDTVLPGTIMIGGSPKTTPAIEPAVLGIKFIALMNSLLAALDAHLHVLPFPFPPTMPLATNMPITGIVGPNVPFSVSKKVLIGA